LMRRMTMTSNSLMLFCSRCMDTEANTTILSRRKCLWAYKIHDFIDGWHDCVACF
jgi:hypothetical protein